MIRGAKKPKPGTTFQERYAIEERLGEGAMAVVYRAYDEQLGRAVALKWLRTQYHADESVGRRFFREVKAAKKIRHPNVVEVFDVERIEGTGAMYMTMELLRGIAFDELLDHRMPSAEEIVDVIVPVLRAVSAAHGSGIVHRDLKPENIFLHGGGVDPGQLGTSKVLDFGISKFMIEGEVSGRITSAGTVVGTPAYMAPEQVRGADADIRCDTYSIGVVLYEALSGRLPFEEDSVRRTFELIVSGQTVPIEEVVPELDPKLATIVMRAIAYDPNDRYQSAESLANALVGVVKRRAGWLPDWMIGR